MNSVQPSFRLIYGLENTEPIHKLEGVAVIDLSPTDC